MILWSWHKIFQIGHREEYEAQPKFKKKNQRMKGVFKLLQRTTLIFGQAHQLATCWTDVCMTFSTFRI